MLWLVGMLACAPGNAPRDGELDALQATHAELRAEIDGLKAELDTLRELAPPAGQAPRRSRSIRSTRCTKRDDGSYRLPSTPVDTDGLAEEARVVRHRNADREVDGYTLSPAGLSPLFYSCGLERNDIVHTVNGIALTSDDALHAAYDAYRSGQSLTVQLTRDDAAVELALHPGE